MNIKTLAAVAALGLSATLTACGSSSTATPSVNASVSQSASASVSASVGGTAGLPALCTGFNGMDFASLAQAKDPASMAKVWQNFAASAPDAIKADVQLFSTYLQALASKDYTAISSEAAGIAAAGQHIAAYVAANCHA